MIQIVATGLNHRSAPLELRERFAIRNDMLAEALQQLYAQPGVEEAVILSTCNRVELYTVELEQHESGHGSASFFRDFFQASESQYINHLYRYHNEKAVRHLFTVASSLDSMVVGEPQILGQVKDFFARAQESGVTGRFLNSLFSRALCVGKRARSETAIGQMAVSVPYAAVELAKKVFDSLKGKNAVLLGRGKMSDITARHLRNAGIGNLYAANRDPEAAAEFAARIGGVPVTYEPGLEFLTPADIVMCSTNAPHLLVTLEPLRKLMAKRHNRVLLLIDISVPRAIDPAANNLEGVYLFNIDHLQEIIEENMRLRMDEARKASVLIEEGVQEFFDWMGSLDIVPTIKAFRDHLEELRASELSRVLRNLEGFAPEQRELIEQFSRALVNKIGHQPSARLRAAADPERAIHYSNALRHLFGLDE